MDKGYKQCFSLLRCCIADRCRGLTLRQPTLVNLCTTTTTTCSSPLSWMKSVVSPPYLFIFVYMHWNASEMYFLCHIWVIWKHLRVDVVSLICALIKKANFDGLCEHGHLAFHVMRFPCSKYFPHIPLVLHAAEATLSSMPSTSTPASPPLHPPDDMSYDTFDINVELELVTHTFLSPDLKICLQHPSRRHQPNCHSWELNCQIFTVGRVHALHDGIIWLFS